MARTRFQEGSLIVVGEGATAKYAVRYRVYDDSNGTSVNKQQIIGIVSKGTKREANKRKQEIFTSGTQQLPKALGGNKTAMTLRQFYEEKCLPFKIK